MAQIPASLLDTCSLYTFSLCSLALASQVVVDFLFSHSLSLIISVFVNTCVLLLPQKRTLLPWTISQVPKSEYTFSDFFRLDICPKLPGNSSSDPAQLYELLSSHVGPSKDSLDPVDLSLPIYPVIDSFGRFLKYCVNINEDFESTCATITNRSALDVIMSSSISTKQQTTVQKNQYNLESIQVVEQNKKNKLHNDIVQFFISRGLSFLSKEEITNSGMRLVCLLREIFWYIDGHHHAFQLCSVPVPKEFECFLNYNVPQLSKHRKRRTINMSADVLKDFNLELSTLLHESYWNRECWFDIKPKVLMLLESLSGYVDYLTSKNKVMKLHHESPSPVHKVSGNLHIKCLFPA